MKLFCFDIDGTLLTFGTNQIPQEELDAMQALLDAGHAVALASGRPFLSLKHHLSPLKGKHKYYVCANGAAVYDNDGNVIKETALTSKDFLHLQRYGGGSVGIYAYEGRGSIVCFEHDKWIQAEKDYNRIGIENITILDRNQPIVGHDRLLKIMIAGDKEEMKDKHLSLEDQQRYEYSMSAPTYLEVLEKGSTKGERVDDLRKHLGIDPSDVYCFGDEDNDISMVSRFNGVAMGNAIPSLKKVAKYITLDVKDHGVSYGLKHILKVI